MCLLIRVHHTREEHYTTDTAVFIYLFCQGDVVIYIYISYMTIETFLYVKVKDFLASYHLYFSLLRSVTLT
jgi:hypothetical protein